MGSRPSSWRAQECAVLSSKSGYEDLKEESEMAVRQQDFVAEQAPTPTLPEFGRMLEQATDVVGNDNEMAPDIQVNPGADPAWLRHQSSIPDDVSAVIEPYPLSVTQHGGRARKNEWRLRFEPREAPFIDWLMGWTGGRDPMIHVDLRFPDKASAQAYCERRGLKYRVHDRPKTRPTPIAQQAFQMEPSLTLCCSPTGPHALCCGDYPCVRA